MFRLERKRKKEMRGRYTHRLSKSSETMSSSSSDGTSADEFPFLYKNEATFLVFTSYIENKTFFTPSSSEIFFAVVHAYLVKLFHSFLL